MRLRLDKLIVVEHFIIIALHSLECLALLRRSKRHTLGSISESWWISIRQVNYTVVFLLLASSGSHGARLGPILHLVLACLLCVIVASILLDLLLRGSCRHGLVSRLLVGDTWWLVEFRNIKSISILAAFRIGRDGRECTGSTWVDLALVD